ncbi:MAG TPA: hypothetical protein VGN73_00105 [Gemmatimonadaceae bacterium]|jgi:hypothetical protein|nr:hypothetical protein [Gemmatimonadaceae bacterium]
MYSTCLFCNTSLGSNEAVEHFPVGRRLAFDASKGRLWAVCRKCERWNLTPIEERWEAIEECERSFRGTKLRVSTDQIGLGRIKEGLELVRIGKPLRPEFAAWRYGDQFGRRRRRNYVRVGAMGLAAVSVPFVQSAVSVAIGVGSLNLFPIISWSIGLYSRYRVVARVRDNAGRPLLVRAHEPEQTVILPPGPGEEWGLRIRHRVVADRRSRWWKYTRDHGQTDIRGDAAMQAAARILPLINHDGANAKQVDQAVKLATEYEDASMPFENAVRFARSSWKNRGPDGLLKQVPKEMRLALEMASHEGAERRALDGELKQLEDAWREAEEIASISDDMFLPQEVSEQLAAIKKRSP